MGSSTPHARVGGRIRYEARRQTPGLMGVWPAPGLRGVAQVAGEFPAIGGSDLLAPTGSNVKPHTLVPAFTRVFPE
ncbi:hypothetical protein Kisp01_19060 [Kineosporia sp. NBRC 101677]|nr:hypothetical protein Kisp01_19060 [Kineosporia sp. NBRC 101677]